MSRPDPARMPAAEQSEIPGRDADLMELLLTAASGLFPGPMLEAMIARLEGQP